MIRMDNQDKATLKCLITGILIYSVLLLIPVLILSGDRLRALLSVLCGAALAILMTVAMQLSADKSLHMETRQEAFLAWMSVARMLILGAVLAVIGFTGVLNVLLVFAGVFGLKISAYMQPVLIKCFTRITSKEGEKFDR